MEIYPLRTRPIFKSRIWGGQNLRTFFGKALPADTLIGESWELSGLKNDESIIDNGPLKGRTITNAIAEFPQAIAGKQNPGQLPLLIKLLDAQDILSVQVHPDQATCIRMGVGEPKTECWYILDAAPGAYIYKGVKKGTTKQAFQAAIQNGTCEHLLEKIPVAPGECHFLPSGTCHAIGPKLLIAEIQQPSDTTYRVFDWNRVDAATGKPRQLHVEQAMESIRFDFTADKLPVTTIGNLVSCEEFNLTKGHQVAGAETLLSPSAMKAIVFVSGCGHIKNVRTEPVSFAPGDVVLIPAAYEGWMEFTQDCEYLTAWTN